jgi:hypothetical protein
MKREENNHKNMVDKRKQKRKISMLNMKQKPMIKAKTQKEAPIVPIKKGRKRV